VIALQQGHITWEEYLDELLVICPIDGAEIAAARSSMEVEYGSDRSDVAAQKGAPET
jgi:hypothetical protein